MNVITIERHASMFTVMLGERLLVCVPYECTSDGDYVSCEDMSVAQAALDVLRITHPQLRGLDSLTAFVCRRWQGEQLWK